jgi:rhodanese-related sulfurtransferase
MEFVANQIIEQEVKDGIAVLVDVREKVEYKEDGLSWAENLPLSSFNVQDYQQFDKKVYLICYSGNRSRKVGKKLLKELGLETFQAQQHMNSVGKKTVSNGWTVDRQFRMTLGVLMAIFLLGFHFVSYWFIVIPFILATGLIVTSIIDRCYMRMGIALLPWNRGKA